MHSNHEQMMNWFKKFPWLPRSILKWLKNIASAWIALPVFKIKVFLERWNILLVAYPDNKKTKIVILTKLFAIYIYPTIFIFLTVIFVLKTHQNFEPLRLIHPLWLKLLQVVEPFTFNIKYYIISKNLWKTYFLSKKILSWID